MKILKPEIALERKNAILNWLTHRYITTGQPVSSKDIYEAGVVNLSPASIRNILQQLENEGYLHQVHASGGRIPTDKAYRFYIDTIINTQRLAEKEKERIEFEYERRISELDEFLKNTTRMLSDLTRKIGFSMVADITKDKIKRIDIVKVSSQSYLLIVITETGLIRHFPLTLHKPQDRLKLREIVSIINKKLKGLPISEIVQVLRKDYLSRDDDGIYRALYDIFTSVMNEEDEVFVEGLSKIYEDVDDFSIEEIRDMARLLEEKERFSRILKERFSQTLEKARMLEFDKTKERRHLIDVSIGSENNIRELGNFSIVTSSYCIKDKGFGLIGVIGHRRMEYPKIISIIDAISSMIEEVISEWEKEIDL